VNFSSNSEIHKNLKEITPDIIYYGISRVKGQKFKVHDFRGRNLSSSWLKSESMNIFNNHFS